MIIIVSLYKNIGGLHGPTLGALGDLSRWGDGLVLAASRSFYIQMLIAFYILQKHYYLLTVYPVLLKSLDHLSLHFLLTF